MDKVRLTGAQIQHLQDRFDVVSNFEGGLTVELRRRDWRPLKVETVEKMLGHKPGSTGWRQIETNWIEADL